DQHQPRADVDHRIANHSLRAPYELGHIAEDQLLSVTLGNGHLSKGFRRRGRQNMMDRKTPVASLEKTAGTDMRAAGIAQQPYVQRIRCLFHDMIKSQAELLQPLGIDLDLKHFQAL